MGGKIRLLAGSVFFLLWTCSVFGSPGDDTGGVVFGLIWKGAAVETSKAPPEREPTLRTVSRDFLADAGQIWSYPAHIQSRDLLPIFALGTAIAVLIPNDERIYGGFRTFRDNHAWVRHLSPLVTQMGFIGGIAAMGAFLGVGLLGRDHQAFETAMLSASAVLQSSLVAQFLQGLSGRQCPRWDDGMDQWAGPVAFFKRHERGEGFHYGAFPSGHTSAAFSLATVIAMEYGEHLWVPIAVYTVAAGVGLSRLTEDEHWLSDVLVGAVLGHVIARLVVRNHKRRHHAQPSVAFGPGGLTVAINWGHNIN